MKKHHHHVEHHGVVLGIILGIIGIAVFIYAFVSNFDVTKKAKEERVSYESRSSEKPVISDVATYSVVGTPSEPVDVFSSSPRPAKVSNVVGYFGGGAFVMYLPDWAVEHWQSRTPAGGGIAFFPKEEIANRTFSDIVIKTAVSSESYNAETLYSKEIGANNYKVCITDTRCEVREGASDVLISEILLSAISDTRIYHVAKETQEGLIVDRYFFDGPHITADVTFATRKQDYGTQGTKVREFIRNIGMEVEQG